MRLKLGSQQKIAVGLDIGYTNIKLTAIEHLKAEKKLLHHAICEIPNSLSLSDKKIREESLLQSISDLFKQLSSKPEMVNIAVSGQSVIVRYLNYPKMSKEEFDKAIKFEAEKHIPFNMDEVIIDSQILGASEQEANQIKVLLVAVKKDTIDYNINLLKKLDVNLNIIDIDSFALINAFEFNYSDINKEESYALLNFGAERTNINIVKGNISCFTRDIAMAGNEFTVAISETAGVELKEAESLKKDPKDKIAQVEEAMGNIFMKMINEIRLSFDYYENQMEKNIDKVFVSGGCAMIPSFDKVVGQSLNLPVEIWNPFGKLNTTGVQEEELKKNAMFFPVAVGLGLRN